MGDWYRYGQVFGRAWNRVFGRAGDRYGYGRKSSAERGTECGVRVSSLREMRATYDRV